ncbi:MAG: LapA family protein [Elusimicrobiota bacterium]
MHLWLISVLIIILLISIIASQNVTPLVLHFLSWRTPEMPIAVLIIGVFLLGIIFSFLLSIGKIVKLSGKIKKLERELAQPQVGEGEKNKQ